MQHSETRAARWRRPAPAALLAATLLAAVNGGTQAQTAPAANPANPVAPNAAAITTPGFPAPAASAGAAGGAPGQPAAPAPLPAPLAGTTPVQPFPGAAMGAPSYNAAVPQPVRPGAMPQPGRPGYGTAAPPPAARAPVPALPTVQSPPVKGLPADAPKLVINGGTHSTNPARRRVIVNGQVVREGADLGAGVVLEQIRRDSVVLGFRGGHFHVTY